HAVCERCGICGCRRSAAGRCCERTCGDRMSTVLPIVLWYGGLIGITLAVLLVLWALALIAIKHATGRFPAGIMLAGLALALAASWAITRATDLNQGNQLVKVHELLMRFVAGSVSTRGALEDVRAVAE